MSRHCAVGLVGEVEVSVVVGYDRMCRHFFLEVSIPGVEEDTEVYDSSFDQRLCVGGRGTFGGLTAVELEERLGELCLVVPEVTLSAVLAEEAGGGGSFVRRW